MKNIIAFIMLCFLMSCKQEVRKLPYYAQVTGNELLNCLYTIYYFLSTI